MSIVGALRLRSAEADATRTVQALSKRESPIYCHTDRDCCQGLAGISG
jgi:hypothetical protein